VLSFHEFQKGLQAVTALPADGWADDTDPLHCVSLVMLVAVVMLLSPSWKIQVAGLMCC
jgi:hypothetical protein